MPNVRQVRYQINIRATSIIWLRPALQLNISWTQTIRLIEHIEAETKWPPFFADDILICIFLNENIWISDQISLKYLTWV